MARRIYIAHGHIEGYTEGGATAQITQYYQWRKKNVNLNVLF